MANYKLRSVILSEGDDKIVKKYDFLDWNKTDFLKGLDIEEHYLKLLSYLGLDYVKECRRTYKSYYQRAKRLRDRIASYLVRGSCIFATFTFSDEVLEKTNKNTRRKYISRFCKSVTDYYVANIDYGVDDRFTHREHYHALLLTDFVSDKWDYGFTWFERVTPCGDSDKLLSKYISKLTNHAIKESTKRNTYIYSRNILS